MRRLIGTTCLLVAALVIGGSPAVARALASGGDPAGDVVITQDQGLPQAARRSIAMRRLTVTRHGRFVRVEMKVRRVDRSPDFTQLYLVDVMAKGFDFGQLSVATHAMSDPPPANGLELDMTVEGADTRQGYVSCRNLRHSLRDGAHRGWVDIPRRCIPESPATLSAYSQTVPGPGAEEHYLQFSHDDLTVSGRHRLGGTAQPEHP